MYLSALASAAFTLVCSWSVGIATGVALADIEGGLIRDHPLFGRRLSAVVVPPLAAAGLLAPLLLLAYNFAQAPRWLLLAMLLLVPFAALAWPWSRAWVRRQPALRRRDLGVQAVAAGLAGLLLVSLVAFAALRPTWNGTVLFMLLAATAAELGALTNFSLLALTAGLPAEVPGGPAANLAELAGAGLLCNLLASLDVGSAQIGAGDWPALARGLEFTWLAAALLIPGCLLLARLYLRRLPDAVIMPLALACAICGQGAALLLVFRFPGLVPPPGL